MHALNHTRMRTTVLLYNGVQRPPLFGSRCGWTSLKYLHLVRSFKSEEAQYCKITCIPTVLYCSQLLGVFWPMLQVITGHLSVNHAGSLLKQHLQEQTFYV